MAVYRPKVKALVEEEKVLEEVKSNAKVPPPPIEAEEDISSEVHQRVEKILETPKSEEKNKARKVEEPKVVETPVAPV